MALEITSIVPSQKIENVELILQYFRNNRLRVCSSYVIDIIILEHTKF